MSISSFIKDIEFASEYYGYKNPSEPGSLPLGIIVKGQKYILIPFKHAMLCDHNDCVHLVNLYKKIFNNKYTKIPIYSQFGKDSLCISCATKISEINHFDNIIQFEPTSYEKKTIYNLFNYTENNN